MKYSLLTLLFVFISSCHTSKQTAEDTSQTSDFAPYIGKIHLNESGCPYYIEVEQVLVSNLSFYIGKKLYPVQLEEKFKKNGQKLKFNLAVSRAPSPSDCQIDYVVSLSNLSISKK
jgi:hypothetical protein